MDLQTIKCLYVASIGLLAMVVMFFLWILVISEFQATQMPILFGGPARLVRWIIKACRKTAKFFKQGI
jgi:hypothetical protein